MTCCQRISLSLAEGSLLNKVFPSNNGRNEMGFLPCLLRTSQTWDNAFGNNILTCHITKSSITPFQQMFEGAIFHCEDKQASSLRICCPCLYHQAIENTFMDSSIFEPVTQDPPTIVDSLVTQLNKQYGKSNPWATGHGRQLPPGYILAKRKKALQSGRPIISFVDSPFRPMLNILVRMIFQRIPVACPNHFASGDVYAFLDILRSAPVDANLVLINQDLAGFFTSIGQERFLGARLINAPGLFTTPHEQRKSSQSLREKLTVQETSSKAAHFVDSTSQGRSSSKMSHPFSQQHSTCRPLRWANDAFVNVDDVEAVQWAARCPQHSASWSFPSANKFGPSTSNKPFHQTHPLRGQSTHLWWRAPSRLAAIWSPSGRRFLWKADHPWNRTRPRIPWFHARNKTSWADLQWTHQHLPGPVPFFGISSKSPSQWLFQMSDVAKGAFPDHRVRQGLDQLIQLYILAGFPSDELHHISSPIMTLRQNGKNGACCGRATVHSRTCFFLNFWLCVPLALLRFFFFLRSSVASPLCSLF